MFRKWVLILAVICGVVLAGCSSDDAEPATTEVKEQYTLEEVNGEAVEVLQGIYAVEVKRENIPEATKNSKVILKVEGKEIPLDYYSKRDSFRDSQIKDIELEKLKEGTVVIKR